MTKSTLPAVNLEALSPFIQPYVRLAQRNMQLMTNFSASPEMVSIWMTSNQMLFEQAMQGKSHGKAGKAPQKVVEQIQKDVSQVSQSKAFSGLVQGLMQSHIEFLMDLAQTSMAALGQAPVQMMKQVQQATVSALPVRAA